MAGKKKKRVDEYNVKTLALWVRYGWPIAMLALTCVLESPLFLGINLCAFALYLFIGYKRRWIHIYCANQEAGRQRMTPNCVDWSQVRKVDAYGVPIAFGLFGIVLTVTGLIFMIKR